VSHDVEGDGGKSPRDLTSIGETFDRFLRDKGKGQQGESGNYRRNAAAELERFEKWCSGQAPEDREVDSDWAGIYVSNVGSRDRPVAVEDIAARYTQQGHNIFRTYARHLRAQAYRASTAQTYYNYVSSWCGWCVQEGRVPLSQHLAAMEAARAPLQSDVDTGERATSSTTEQYWTPEQRDAIVQYADRCVWDTLDEQEAIEDPQSREYEQATHRLLKCLRDRALVVLIAYSGVRGAEILRDTDDERREGARWEDLSLKDQSLRVLRKRQVIDTVTLPKPVIDPLRRYCDRLEPPSEGWPIFPTMHYPTIARLVRETLRERGHDNDEIAAIREEYAYDFELTLDRDIPLPSMSVRSGRRLIEDISTTDDASIPDLADDEALELHGARRGMGEVLVRTQGYAAAARFLDNSEEMVRERYSHIDPDDQAAAVTASLVETDDTVQLSDDE